MVRLEHVLVLAGVVAVSARSYIQYSTVPGYFLQDDNSTNATTFDYVSMRNFVKLRLLTFLSNCNKLRLNQPVLSD